MIKAGSILYAIVMASLIGYFIWLSAAPIDEIEQEIEYSGCGTMRMTTTGWYRGGWFSKRRITRYSTVITDKKNIKYMGGYFGAPTMNDSVKTAQYNYVQRGHEKEKKRIDEYEENN
jgi:hypothetical protein